MHEDNTLQQLTTQCLPPDLDRMAPVSSLELCCCTPLTEATSLMPSVSPEETNTTIYITCLFFITDTTDQSFMFFQP